MAEPFRALLVDDEPLALANLAHALRQAGGWSVRAECAGVASARAALRANPVDVVFLDIQMPGESGLSFARELAAQPDAPLIVFVTAFDEHAIDAFEVHALDYLLKPVEDDRLARTLVRAEELVRMRQRAAYQAATLDAAGDIEQAQAVRDLAPLSRVCVRSVGKVESVPLGAVRWLRSAGNYVELHLADRMVLHRVPLGQLERRLDPDVFLRVHRTAIVRRGLVQAFETLAEGNYRLRLEDGTYVPVSERHVAAVRSLLDD